MNVIVIGGGAGALATCVELARGGFEVSAYIRSEGVRKAIQAGGITYDGVLGSGTMHGINVYGDLSSAIQTADVAVIALPTFAHAELAKSLAMAGWGAVRPIVLNPGHTGGALEFSYRFCQQSRVRPAVVEFSTLAYVARKRAENAVWITGRARSLRAASLNAGKGAVALAAQMFPGVYDTGDVLACDLSNVNMVLHPPGAILGAAWVESTGGNYRFYVDGMTPGVGRVMKCLDDERREVGRAFGHELPGLVAEMKALGTVEADADECDFVKAISGGVANSAIRAPDSLEHRYYVEDFGHGLTPFVALAAIAGIDVPAAHALNELGRRLASSDDRAVRDADAMGLRGVGKEQLLHLVAEH